MNRYELIENLTEVYCSQDCDYFGETGAEIMAEYRKACAPAELEALRAEIVDCMRSHPDLEATGPPRGDGSSSCAAHCDKACLLCRLGP